MTDQDSKIVQAIQKAFKLLCDEDGALFGLPLESESSEARKLHEVCINHKLAEKLSAQPIFSRSEDIVLYTDIEFNREGVNQKWLKGKLERPDIIVHNRQSGDEKLNLLVVECKKKSASFEAKQEDLRKVQDFITSEAYAYHYGLCVIYRTNSVQGTLYVRDDSEAESPKAVLLKEIEYP